MAPLVRAGTGPASVAPFDAADRHATPKFELALTSLVVMALLASAVIVSIAVVAPQVQSGGLGSLGIVGAAATTDKTMAFNADNKAETEILDRDLYPFCLNAGDRSLASIQYKPMRSQDTLATAQDGQAAKVGYTIAAPVTAALPQPKMAFVPTIGDLGCGVGYYK